MAVELNRSEFIQLRLHHQHLLTGGVKLSVLLEHLMAIQGQDFPAAVNVVNPADVFWIQEITATRGFGAKRTHSYVARGWH